MVFRAGRRPAMWILLQAPSHRDPADGERIHRILKDTSLLSILSIRDLTQRMREFQSATFLTFAPYNTVAIVYVLLTLIAVSLVARVETPLPPITGISGTTWVVTGVRGGWDSASASTPARGANVMSLSRRPGPAMRGVGHIAL